MASNFSPVHSVQEVWYSTKHSLYYLPFSPWSKGRGGEERLLAHQKRPKLWSVCVSPGVLLLGKNLLAAAVEGEAVHHDNKCGAQCSHFKFKKFQVAYIMLTSTVVCHSTHKGIDQDLPWKSPTGSLAWCSSNPSAPAFSTAMGWSQRYRSSIPLGHDLPTASDTTGLPPSWLSHLACVGGKCAYRTCTVGQKEDCSSKEVGGRGRDTEAGGGEPSCTVPLLPITCHPPASGSSRSWSPSSVWWQTQSNRVTFPHSAQLCPTSAYWWSGVV